MQIENDNFLEKQSNLKISDMEVDINALFRRIKALEETKPSLPLASIVCFPINPDDERYKLLNGQCISLSGEYKDFCDYIISLYNSNSAAVPVCSISTYASENASYGQCGKFVINQTSAAITSGSYTCDAFSIKLPNITKFIASSNSGFSLGESQSEAFKSHRHFSWETDEGSHKSFYGTAITADEFNHQKLLGAIRHAGVNNSAGDYYTSYEGGTETRPTNIRYPYYIVVKE